MSRDDLYYLLFNINKKSNEIKLIMEYEFINKN